MVLPARTWWFRLLVAAVATLLVVGGFGGSAPARAADPLTDQVTIVMAVPAGGAQDSTTLQQVVDAVNGPVADYWNQQSGGAIRIGVTHQVDWYQSAFTCSDPSGMFAEAGQRAGWSRADGQHLLLYLPAGSAGCGKVYADNGSYLHEPGRVRVTTLSTSVIARGFGSNLGAERSDAYQCDGAVDSGSCQIVSLGDHYDVMGGLQDQLGSLSMLHAAKLGVLPPQQQVALSMSDAPTTVTLAPVSGTTGVRALSLTVPGGAVYWLEYRPASGQDAWLGTAANTRGLEPGVLLRMSMGGNPSLLLDGTPSAASGWGTDTHQALPVGSALSLADGMFGVTVTSEGANAVVRVVPSSPIARAHDAYGGDTGTLGAPTGAEQCAGPDYATYCYRTYQHGNIYWSLPQGAHAVQGDILRDWLVTGGPGGSFGLPTQDAVCGPGGGCTQQFQAGTLSSSPGGWSAATNRLPSGILDSVTASAVSLTLAGWAIDPDQPTAPVTVHVYIDGQWGTALTAAQSRADVGAAFPSAGAAHGFSWSTRPTPGTHSVCLYAIDLQLPSTHTDMGCRTYTVPMTLPWGSLDTLSVSGTTLSFGGWAFDPDSPSATTLVRVAVDGAWMTSLPADQSRPDVGATFPSAGAAHGFSGSTALTPAAHTVCLDAMDVQPSGDYAVLGCRTVAVEMTPPWGSLDSVSATGTTLTLNGWAFDPDSPTQAGQVHVYVDGRWGTALTADQSRPDVGAAIPAAGAAHGFSWSTTLAAGTHSVCLYAIDVQLPSTHTDLGCRTVTVATTLPWGTLDTVAASGTTLSVGGWAFDPDSPTQAGQVHVYVDGRWGTALTADQSRPDVGAAFPQAGAAHGFGWTTTVTPGTHTVCLYAIDVQLPSTHTDLGCRTVG